MVDTSAPDRAEDESGEVKNIQLLYAGPYTIKRVTVEGG